MSTMHVDDIERQGLKADKVQMQCLRSVEGLKQVTWQTAGLCCHPKAAHSNLSASCNEGVTPGKG